MKFTRENAAEMARRSHGPKSARNLQPEFVPLNSPSASKSAEERRRETLAQQVDLLDKLIAKANGSERVLRLIHAKAKLWELLYPKPGSLRPGKTRDRMPAPSPIAPLPIEPASPLVAPGSEQNHNEQNPQSQAAA